jgi:hypothetical protein
VPKVAADERAGQGAHRDLEEHGVIRIAKPEGQRLGLDPFSLAPEEVQDGVDVVERKLELGTGEDAGILGEDALVEGQTDLAREDEIEDGGGETPGSQQPASVAKLATICLHRVARKVQLQPRSSSLRVAGEQVAEDRGA